MVLCSHKGTDQHPILRITREELDHLPDLYRFYAEHLIEIKDPRIALVEEGP